MVKMSSTISQPIAMWPTGVCRSRLSVRTRVITTVLATDIDTPNAAADHADQPNAIITPVPRAVAAVIVREHGVRLGVEAETIQLETLRHRSLEQLGRVYGHLESVLDEVRAGIGRVEEEQEDLHEATAAAAARLGVEPPANSPEESQYVIEHSGAHRGTLDIKKGGVLPVVTIAIRADGSVEKVTFVVSSGVPAIDEAIRQVVASQAPYGPFPPALARQYDVIEIRRTWIFDVAIRLQ